MLQHKMYRAILVVALLAGCAVSKPKQTLQDEMAGMNAVERQDFLYHKCREKARYRTKNRHSEFQGDPAASESPRYRMRMICERMHDQMTGEITE